MIVMMIAGCLFHIHRRHTGYLATLLLFCHRAGIRERIARLYAAWMRQSSLQGCIYSVSCNPLPDSAPTLNKCNKVELVNQYQRVSQDVVFIHV